MDELLRDVSAIHLRGGTPLLHRVLKLPAMMKRTIKPAAGDSHVTPAAAKAAARVVYRDRRTGRLVVAGRGMSREAVLKQARAPKR
jgi:hypothetical protein